MTARPALRDQRRDTLRVIAGAGQAERPRLRPWLVFVFVVTLAFFGLIISRISLDQSAFVLDELEERIAVAEADYWDLRLEVARLQDPERIAAAARHALDVPRTGGGELEPEERWAQLKALLSAQP